MQLLSRSAASSSLAHSALPIRPLPPPSLLSSLRSAHVCSSHALLRSLPELLAFPNLNAKLVYRLLVILGTLIYEDTNTTELAIALEIPDAVETVRKAHPSDQPVQDVSREIKQALNKKA